VVIPKAPVYFVYWKNGYRFHWYWFCCT